MKKFLLLLFVLIIMLPSAKSQVLLHETFTSALKPEGWKLEDYSQSFESWYWEFSEGSSPLGYATHVYYMSSLYTRPANSWMITKAVPLISGQTYTVQFDVRVNTELGSGGVQVNGPAKLRVKVGKTQTANSLTTEIYNDNNISNTTWQTITRTFIADETTNFYFGFHCYSSGGGLMNNAVNIRVDNVKIFQGSGQMSSAKDILSFSFVEQIAPANINTASAEVNITVNASANLSNLVPTITVSEFASINPPSGQARDFSNDVQYVVTAQDASTKVWTVKVSKGTNIENSKNVNINVYPNPANQVLYIDGLKKNSVIQIYDILGNLCFEKNIDSETESIDISYLLSGQYILTITTRNEVTRRKLFVY